MCLAATWRSRRPAACAARPGPPAARAGVRAEFIKNGPRGYSPEEGNPQAEGLNNKLRSYPVVRRSRETNSSPIDPVIRFKAGERKADVMAPYLAAGPAGPAVTCWSPWQVRAVAVARNFPSGRPGEQAMYAVAVLGVPDALADGPRSIPDLAQATGAHEPSLLTEPAPDQVALTPLGRTLAGGHPESMRDVAITWMETHYAPFSELAGTVRASLPACDRYHGMPVFEWFAAHPADAATFSRAMANLTDGIRPGVIAVLRLDGIRTLVDVGGADGSLLAGILVAHPGYERGGR